MRAFFVVAAGFGAAVIILLANAGGAAARQPAPASVTLVHGVRGLVADVYLDGALALPAFEPERTTDALSIPAGPHAVAVRTAGAAPDSEPVVAADVDLPAGARLSAVVHLAADGSPTITLYPDDATPERPGFARVVVRHAAAAPPVDVSLDGSTVASALPNAQEAGAEAAPGNHTVAVALAGGATPAVPPEDVPFDEGTANVLYLVGAASDNSLVWLAQRVEGLASAPTAVQTGSEGLAAPRSFPVLTVALLALVGAVSAAGTFWSWRRAG